MKSTGDQAEQQGARWIRAALQVNPYEYEGKGSPKRKFADEAAYNKALLDECERQGITLLAVTDHWRVSTAMQLIADAAARNIVALPGFEANSAEAVHALVIFEVGTSTDDIAAAIGVRGAKPGADNGTVGKPLAEIIDQMTKHGALVIPAHTNVQKSGLLARISGNALSKVIKDPLLLAIGITPSEPDLGDQADILKGKNPYKREHPLVAIYADDVTDPSALQSQGASTWFKVSEPRLESLKHAIKTPTTRVSLVDPSSTARVLLRNVSWAGGYLDGQTIPIADDLTALIGGPGTGKSTTIESLRYVLGVKPLTKSVVDDHDSIVSGVLRSGTTVQLTVDVIAPSPARYTIERTVPHPPVVRDASGTLTQLKPEDVLGQIEIFGQHELAQLAEDPDRVAEMVNRIAGKPTAAAGRLDILKLLKENREKLGAAEQDREDLEDELADIPRLTEQANHFKSSDLGKRLEEKTRFAQDEGVFKDGGERLEEVEAALDEFVSADLVDSLRIKLEGIDGSSQEPTLRLIESAVDELANVLEKAQAEITTGIETAKKSIEDARKKWDTDTKPQRDRHDEVVRELVKEGFNPDEYISTTTQLDRLTKKAERRKTSDKLLKGLRDTRKTLLQRLAESDKAISAELNSSIRQANDSGSKAVVARPVASPDRSAIKQVIEKHFKGQRGLVMAAVERNDFSPRAFVAAARAGADQLKDQYSIVGSQQQEIIRCGEALYRELEELSVGQAVEVLLDVSVPGQPRELKRLEELSKGQRATALLLLLLGTSTTPLIIDQPEDDLDNRFIYGGIVTRLRDLKGTRQILVSTHNANVPVLGDAELLVTLLSDGQRGWTASDGVGSLDNPRIRELAEDILEGGRDAFDARFHLYGF